MATVDLHVDSHDVHAHDDHEHHELSFIQKYIFSEDHKVIAKQFLISGMLWAIIGGGMSMLFRLQLGFPGSNLDWLKPLLGGWIENGKMNPEFYLALVTMHGTIMVFFVLTAGLSGTFSNFLIPLQIGARDMASGFLNMLSYWFFFASSVLMFCSIFTETGPASGGWVIYPPLSALPQAMSGSGLGMTLWLCSMSLFIVSSLLGSINYITTVINLRTKGMSFLRMPLTIWAFFVTAIIGVLAFPVLFSAALLLIFDRSFGTSFYLSEIYIAGEALHNMGGSPVLFQHLFWFLGHPEVYIVLLPALGVTSEIIATNSRKPIFGYKAMIGSIFGIAFLSFIVWAHHMFVTGMNPFLGSIFMLLTLVIAVPSAVKAFNFIATLWRGNIVFTPAMLFSIGLVSYFISVIYPGYDESIFNLQNKNRIKEASHLQHGVPQNGFNIGFYTSGGFNKRGIDIFIDTLRLLPKSILANSFIIIVGKTDDQKKINIELKSVGLKESQFKIFEPIQDVLSLLCLSDIIVHPAYFEEFGMIVQEALATGIPVLSSLKVGATEINQNVLITSPEKPEAAIFASQLEVIFNDSIKYKQLSELSAHSTLKNTFKFHLEKLDGVIENLK